MFFEWLFLANMTAAALMTGLIWVIQIVQYPGFRHLSPDDLVDFHLYHVRRISFVAAPLMMAELLTSFALTLLFDRLFMINFLGLLMVIALWVITFMVQMPIHSKLQHEASRDDLQQLISSNWLRTLLWSARLMLCLYGFSYLMAG